MKPTSIKGIDPQGSNQKNVAKDATKQPTTAITQSPQKKTVPSPNRGDYVAPSPSAGNPPVISKHQSPQVQTHSTPTSEPISEGSTVAKAVSSAPSKSENVWFSKAQHRQQQQATQPVVSNKPKSSAPVTTTTSTMPQPHTTFSSSKSVPEPPQKQNLLPPQSQQLTQQQLDFINSLGSSFQPEVISTNDQSPVSASILSNLNQKLNSLSIQSKQADLQQQEHLLPYQQEHMFVHSPYYPSAASFPQQAYLVPGQDDSEKGKVKMSLAFQSAMNYYYGLPQQQLMHQHQEADETPSRILWVGNISNEVSENDLENEFGQFGKIESLRILHNRYCAFINFEEEEPAKRAKQSLNGAILGGQYIVVNFRKPDTKAPVLSHDSPLSSSNSISSGISNISGSSTSSINPNETIILNKPSRALWIGNISTEVTEDDLYKEFSNFGEIESVRLLRAKTCAFVNFIQIEDATRALHTLQGKVMGNMAIKINFGKPQLPPKKRFAGRGLIGDDYDPYSLSAPTAFIPIGISPGQGMFPGGFAPYMANPNYYYNSGPHGLDPYATQMYFPASTICEMCMANYKEYAFVPCGHACCADCVGKVRASTIMNGEKSAKCPYCREFIQKYLEVSFNAPFPTPNASSTLVDPTLSLIPPGYPQTT